MCSRPALRRMKPSGTASPPQRARRSAQVQVPPKLVASVMSFALEKKFSAAALFGEVEAEDGAEVLHLARGDGVAGMRGQAGIEDVWTTSVRVVRYSAMRWALD